MAHTKELPPIEKKKNILEGAKSLACNLGLTVLMAYSGGAIGGGMMHATTEANKYKEMPTTPPIESLIEYAGNNFGNVAGPEALQRATSKEGNKESHKLLAGFTKAYIEEYKLSKSTLGAEYKAQEFLLKNGAKSSPEIEMKQQTNVKFLVPNTRPVELKHGLTTKQFEAKHQEKLESAKQTGEFGGRAIGFAAGVGISMLNVFKGFSKRKEQAIDDAFNRKLDTKEVLNQNYDNRDRSLEQQRLQSLFEDKNAYRRVKDLERKDQLTKRESRKVAAFREALLSKNDLNSSKS